MEYELSEDCDIEELAAAQSGLWRANDVVIRRRFPAREDLVAVARSLSGIRYVPDRPRDIGTVITRLLARGYGDCEDLSSAWHSVLRALWGRTSDVQSLLTHGGRPGQFHAFLRVHGRTFDPSVAGYAVPGFAPVLGGMGRPPNSIYCDPRAVVIAP